MNEDKMDTEVIGCKPKNEILSSYWYWKKAISDSLIDCFFDEIKDLPFKQAKTFSSVIDGYEKTPDYRNSDIILFDPIHWLSGILFNYAIRANIQAEWNIGVTVPQTLQLAQYGPSQHYGWHDDSDFFFKRAAIRKLSVICMLSDKSEYDGGQFEFEHTGQIEFDKGDIIVFPSFLRHRVNPVTSGIRKTSTLWILGNRN
jgi:PKHD-type hydroxylase